MMARRVKISAATLNVRLHPHNPKLYASWLQHIYIKRVSAQIHGDRKGVISSINKRQLDDDILTGVITTFVELDDDGVWFNLEKLEEATVDQVSQIKIPKNLYPNSSSFLFHFDTRRHKLFVQSYSKGKLITPQSLLKLFQGLAGNISVMSHYGEAKISLVQETASLNKMLGLRVLKSVQMTILRPNTDIFDDDFEQKVEAHLAENNSKEMTIGYAAETGSSLTPTDEMKALGKVALQNGHVEVSGRNAKGAVKLNSQSFPQLLQDRYDPDIKLEEQAFRDLIPPREG